MGKGSGVFCAMLFSCLLLTGCAENPTEDIVVNKNEGKLEQAIQRENKKDSDTSVPEKYTDQFQADEEKIEVSVDASVTGLEENKPVVRVKPHLITEEEAKRWADVLFEGATAYEPGEKSKTEIEDRILQLKERIGDQDKLLEDYGSQEEADRIKKELEEEIKEYGTVKMLLPEAGTLERAVTYRDKKIKPLFLQIKNKVAVMAAQVKELTKEVEGWMRKYQKVKQKYNAIQRELDDIRKDNQKLSEEKDILQGVSDRYDRVVRVLGIETVDAAVQQDIRNEKALEEKQRMEQMPKGNIHERLAWGMKKSEMENQQRKKTKSKNREMER